MLVGVAPNPAKDGIPGVAEACSWLVGDVEGTSRGELTEDAFEAAADVESGVAPLRFGRPFILSRCSM